MSKVWGANGKMDVDDVWDDTELIKMYEESIQEQIPAAPKKMVKEKKFHGPDDKQYLWKVGGKCMAPFTDETGKTEYFAANIDWIEENSLTVGVTFLYYGNEATVEMKDLWENEDAVAEAEEAERKEKKKSTQIAGVFPSGPSIPLPSFAPPVPPNIVGMVPASEREALSSMLMSWYMSGYHTGYYQAITDQKK